MMVVAKYRLGEGTNTRQDVKVLVRCKKSWGQSPVTRKCTWYQSLHCNLVATWVLIRCWLLTITYTLYLQLLVLCGL